MKATFDFRKVDDLMGKGDYDIAGQAIADQIYKEIIDDLIAFSKPQWYECIGDKSSGRRQTRSEHWRSLR